MILTKVRMARRPTIVDLPKFRASLSLPSTVSLERFEFKLDRNSNQNCLNSDAYDFNENPKRFNRRHPVRTSPENKVLTAAEAIGYCATQALRERLDVRRPITRLGFLSQQSNRPYCQMRASALAYAALDAGPKVQLVAEQMNDLAPEAVAARLLDMRNRVDASAAISAEHPRIAQAIVALAARHISVFGLISGLTAACGTGYVGLDNWQVGRTAVWAIAGLCRLPGRDGILVGNHRYRCQEMNETGCRSYFWEIGGEFTLPEQISKFEDRRVA